MTVPICARAAFVLLVVRAHPVLAQSAHERCVDVEVGTSQSYDCINQNLQALSRQAHQPASTAAPDIGKIPSNQTGQFNEDATRNRLGANYGKSVTPARPNALAPPKHESSR